jgi:hypothetical protein
MKDRIVFETASKSSASSAAIAPMPASARSKISNGSAVLPGVDGRSTWVRRLRDLVSLHLNDLGGDDAVSEAERSIVRRVATLTVELERMEAGFAMAGEALPEQLDLYQRTAGNLRRLLEAIGLERRSRNVTRSVAEYVADTAADADEEATAA